MKIQKERKREGRIIPAELVAWLLQAEREFGKTAKETEAASVSILGGRPLYALKSSQIKHEIQHSFGA